MPVREERKLRASAVREQGDLMGSGFRPWHGDLQCRGSGVWALAGVLTAQHKGTQAGGSKAGPVVVSGLVVAEQLAFLGMSK